MLLLQNVSILDPMSPYHGQVSDILIANNGNIETIAPDIQAIGARKIDLTGHCVSIGWLDIGTQACDPGYEHREDLLSVANAAISGGFTALAIAPNTAPSIHSGTEVAYIFNATKRLLPDVFPLGAISVNCAGKDLAELFDMHTSGVVAFTDGSKPVQDSGLMLRALEYSRAFGGKIMNTPYDKTLAPHGQIHEGEVSTSLGLPGIPSLAEEMMLLRDLRLAEYAEAPIHISNIATAKAVEIVRTAKANGQKVTCSAAIANCIFDDTELATFDNHFKLMPPLRDKTDVVAIQNGLADGTIDFLTTNHTPWDTEAVELEFPYAKFGMIALETALALTFTYLRGKLSTERIIELWGVAPRQFLNQAVPSINIGCRANLTVFSPDYAWVFSKSDIKSKSKNTPFVGANFVGKTVGVVVGNLTSLW